MQNPGWIKIDRSILDSYVMSDEHLFYVWSQLLLRANWKPNWFRRQQIQRGELAFSYKNLSELLSIDVSQLRRDFELLKKQGMIKVRSTNKFSVLIICNYEAYQDEEPAQTPNEDQTTHKQNVINESIDLIKEGNNTKNLKQQTPCRDSDESQREKPSKANATHTKLAHWFWKGIHEMQPKRKKPNLVTWTDEFRKLMELDKRDPHEIVELVKAIRKDDFWNTNVLAPEKLRKQYDNLVLKLLTSKPSQKIDDHLKPITLTPEQLKEMGLDEL